MDLQFKYRNLTFSPYNLHSSFLNIFFLFLGEEGGGRFRKPAVNRTRFCFRIII